MKALFVERISAHSAKKKLQASVAPAKEESSFSYRFLFFFHP
jgi:hypothetical protein